MKDYVKSFVLHMGKLYKLKERKVQVKSNSQIVAMETWMNYDVYGKKNR